MPEPTSTTGFFASLLSTPEGSKASLFVGGLVGGLVSMTFIKMPVKQRIAAIGSGIAMASYIGSWVSGFVGLDPEATGFLIGLFGISICNLIFESIKKSDLSVKWADVIALFRRQ